jgi:uncharacterized phage protein (TIGR01671 family)
MREYLFHGKRVDNGEWVEGYYVKAQKLNGSNEYEHFIIEEAATGQSHLIIPETIGEFTGIYDINKRKIFENDIVRTQPYTDRPYSQRAKSKQHIGVIEYYTRHFKNRFHEQIYDAGWQVKVKDFGKFTCYDWSEFFKCEVIGNVFDNADLLEG